MRLIIEKPFGHELASALELQKVIEKYFDEREVFRIDHYLGKETVQNMMALRFANGIFEPIWNRQFVDHVQITVAETMGIEGRAGYYEQAGAIRDISTASKLFGGAEHTIIPDRIEAGTFIVAAAITGGELEIKSCVPAALPPLWKNYANQRGYLELNQSTLTSTRPPVSTAVIPASTAAHELQADAFNVGLNDQAVAAAAAAVLCTPAS